ncbi:MAG: hypothetical protein JW699_07640 [Chitinispirillaceae bacterium]|nr:hypothetical protein [Chitinispirillaceae bacterium]
MRAKRELRKELIVCAAIIVAAAGAGYGEGDAVTLVPSGFVALREGQVVKGESECFKSLARPDHAWVQGMDVGFNVQARFNNLPVTGNLGMEMLVCNDNTPYPQDLGQSRRLNFYPYLSRADLTYTFGDKENPSLTLSAGYFPFKYNSEVRNLGEYLFRSGTYPQYLITNFDFPMTRLMGVRASGFLGSTINWDVLLTTNIEWTAIGDPNLSALLSWKPLPLLELGLGASWCSIVSVNLDNTSPPDEGNAYIYNGAKYYYTFAGQKVMGRLALDLKQLFPGSDLFGKQELMLYSEAAVLGLINYPVSFDGYTRYDTLLQRIPVMAGFNFPTYKILDILNLEVEWFGNPYVNSLNSNKFENYPTPLSSHAGEKNPRYLNNHGDDWKWSVYGKKTFADHFNITFQFARDHYRWFRLDYRFEDGKEALRRNDEWYYTFKFGYTF